MLYAVMPNKHNLYGKKKDGQAILFQQIPNDLFKACYILCNRFKLSISNGFQRVTHH